MPNDGHCLPKLEGNLTLKNISTKLSMKSIYARTEISQDADNADKKSKMVSESS